MTTSTFFGLELSLRAMQAQQAGLDTTSHNVANANTKGFSRQSVVLEPTTPFMLPAFNRLQQAGQLGTGVAAVTIERARDLFLDVQYRTQDGLQHQAQMTQQALEQIEVVLNEPSDYGLSAQLGAFFNAWQELANDPSSAGARGSLLQAASALTAGFNRAAQQLSALQTDLNDQVQARVTEINDLANQLVALNKQVVQAESVGQRANDFRDQRDLALDRLAEIVPITVNENADGSLTVLLGGQALVQGNTVDPLVTTPTGPNGAWEVRFASNNALVSASAGELRGLLDARDQTVPSYLNELDTIASNLITAVNGLHSAGYGQDGVTGRAFFTGTDAATIAVDPAVASNPQAIAAASASNAPGDNRTALAIAQLRQSMSPSPEEAFGALIARLGQEAKAASDLATNQGALVQLLDRRRQEVSGVSLDEEAVQMLRYQKAYEAAARVLTAYDQMLDRLINDTGIVGR
ncbi:MAG TPA: flagellar hook-associated protein FlgK [Chloroflexota bacterium]|jgi:flagellar hook-associated protein 1 FlgK|nr:flagellar hook-associated protein FlgK [Chloroflexota bacterium]